MRKIVTLHAGRAQLRNYGNRIMKTAIAKLPAERAALGFGGMAGDEQADLKHHGGPDRALCLYPLEHYRFWNETFGRELSLPAFGENASVTGMLEENVFIGDVYSAGTCIFQITEGRIPCATISMQNGEPSFLKKLMETAYTGYFARVLQEGVLDKGDEIVLVERKQEKISVLYASQVILNKKDGLEGAKAVLEAEGLSRDWQKRLLRRTGC
ncbi:MOSC domain-containing protein [Peribacillus sp. SCS-37]|uniref:MOSC domain-containing protein n=1 Tax=Paraperibacillus esterisolvens TaxID=3115296 RepID=UPI0039061A67